MRVRIDEHSAGSGWHRVAILTNFKEGRTVGFLQSETRAAARTCERVGSEQSRGVTRTTLLRHSRTSFGNAHADALVAAARTHRADHSGRYNMLGYLPTTSCPLAFDAISIEYVTQYDIFHARCYHWPVRQEPRFAGHEDRAVGPIFRDLAV